MESAEISKSRFPQQSYESHGCFDKAAQRATGRNVLPLTRTSTARSTEQPFNCIKYSNVVISAFFSQTTNALHLTQPLSKSFSLHVNKSSAYRRWIDVSCFIAMIYAMLCILHPCSCAPSVTLHPQSSFEKVLLFVPCLHCELSKCSASLGEERPNLHFNLAAGN